MPHVLHPSNATLAAPVDRCRENRYPRPVAYGSRRRKSGVRSAGCGTFLFLAMMLASTAGASPFKRWGNRKAGKGGQQQSVSSKRSTAGKRDKVKEDVAWLLEDASDGGWKPVRDDGRVKVWKRSIPGSDFVAIKSSATLSVSPQALFEVLTPGDIEIVKQYNALVENGRDLEVIDRDNKVSWSATMAIWPCRPRDFVTHIRRATLEDGSVAIVNSATTHPKAPVSSRYVRGEISRGVFHIKAAKNKKQQSELTMVHHFNPGGNVPAWLMNWLAEGKPLTFVRQLEEIAAKWDEQANRSRTMPCKGRGFADKPCEFLLSSKDDAEHADGGNLGWAWANRSGGEWLALAAVLVTTALALSGRVIAICRDSPLATLVGLVGLGGADTEEESSPAVIGQKLKEENGTHAVVDATQTSAPGAPVDSVLEASVESVLEASVENISAESLENVLELSVERVSTGEIGEGGAVSGGVSAGGIADRVVIGDLVSVETNGVKLSCPEEEVTVDKSFGGQVFTDKAVSDGQDTPTGEAMTSDVSSEELRDGEVHGGSSDGLTQVSRGKETFGKLLLDHVAAEKSSNQAMSDDEVVNGENIAVGMPDGKIGNGEDIVVNGVGAEGGSREQESNGGVGDEVSTDGAAAAVGCVSEEAGCKANGYR